MKPEKKFDCLRMKDEIQAKLREQWRGLSREQIREAISHSLATSDNSIAVWWRSTETAQPAPR